MKKLIFVAIVMIKFTLITYGAEIHLSPSGKDSNDGSINSPLATFYAARDKADQLKAGNKPVTVYFHEGTYYLTEPVIFGPSNSGTSTAPIIYTAYLNEKPVISGGIKVNSSWTTSSNQIMKTSIQKDLKVDQLFLNGKRQILARYPNYSSGKVLDGYAGDCIGKDRVKKWNNPTEGPGYVRALHKNAWCGVSHIITGKSTDTVTTRWVGDSHTSAKDEMHITYRMVENIFEELDAPGEWFYRKSTGELFFYPPSGTNLNTSTIELASQDELIRVVGTASARTSHITIKGLIFTHTHRTLFSKPYTPLLKSDWAIARAGTIFLENSENIRIESCTFDQIGGNGVFVNRYNRKHVIFNNKFTDAGASCVAICGPMEAVRCAQTKYDPTSCDDKTPGPKSEDYPAYILVDNNTMYNFGRFEKQTAGVNLSMTMKDTIRHNTIYKMPRAGINITDGCWGGHLIENNWVYESVLETSDHGPFNAWGRDRISRWNGDTSAAKLDAMHTTVIRNNRFEGKIPDFGIDLDDNASNYMQYNNLCIGVGLKIQWSRYNTYVNNIIVNGGVVDFHTIWENNKHYVARNIFAGSVVYSLDNNETPSLIKARIKMLDSNCIWNSGNDPKISRWRQRDNFPFTWSQWKNTGLDAHSIIQDPMFIDPSKGDYRVKDNSPALKLGFKNFPMDSFGVRKIDIVSAHKPHSDKIKGLDATHKIASFRSGLLSISCKENYRVTILNALGRAVVVYNSKGNSNIALKSEYIGAGIYFAIINANGRIEKHRLLIQ